MLIVCVQYRRALLFSFFFLIAIGLPASLALAASVTLSWQDNSTDEDGFKIERATNGSTYTEIASVAANTQSYVDSGLVAGSSYCFRVRSFNANGVSSPSNDSCATIPVTTFTLNLAKLGAGSGSVTSVPAGIICGTDCSEIYSSGTVVSLTATPASGSTFAGWSGDSDCLDGIVTMSVNKSCIATFNATTLGYTLTIGITSVVTTEGSGSGSVNSNPAGINCGSDCSEAYSSGTVVSLTPVAAAGSIFAGWSGDTDCLDGIVTMNVSKSCSAAFKLDTVTLNVLRSGNGTVTSSPSGINCGTACSKNYAKGTKVTLSAKASSGDLFAGWSGGGCQGLADCTVSLANSTSVSATFVGQKRSAIGIFRPANGQWFLDLNGNGIWDGCNVDLCLGPFGGTGDLPIIGDWTGSGMQNIGIFRPSTGEWFLDLNGNGTLDGCNIDRCLRTSSSQNGLPFAGDWNGSGLDMIGELIPGRTAKWYLDINSDGTLDCNSDLCFKFIANDGDLPVAGDWNGSGKSKIGVFRPSTGAWYLDLNGDGQWKNCTFEICMKSFGTAGDRPVAGDWTGNGKTKIGVYRAATGEWFLDLNGNGKWDGSATDGYSQFIDKQDGDLPVVGIW